MARFPDCEHPENGMGDNVSEDDFEVDGVPVDYAGPGENDVDGTDSVHEAALVMDDDEGRVIDSVGPSDDLEEFNQMEPLGEGEGVKLDDAMEDNENRPASAKVTRPAEVCFCSLTFFKTYVGLFLQLDRWQKWKKKKDALSK